MTTDETNEEVLRRMIGEAADALVAAALTGSPVADLDAAYSAAIARYERHHGRYVWDRYGRAPVRPPATW